MGSQRYEDQGFFEKLAHLPAQLDTKVLVVVVVVSTTLAWLIGRHPGNVALKRGHPNAEAIRLLGLAGMFLTAGILWFVAMIWAYTNPLTKSVDSGGATRPCPRCAEPIREAAKVCRFCSHELGESLRAEDRVTNKPQALLVDEPFNAAPASHSNRRARRQVNAREEVADETAAPARLTKALPFDQDHGAVAERQSPPRTLTLFGGLWPKAMVACVAIVGLTIALVHFGSKKRAGGPTRAAAAEQEDRSTAIDSETLPLMQKPKAMAAESCSAKALQCSAILRGISSVALRERHVLARQARMEGRYDDAICLTRTYSDSTDRVLAGAAFYEMSMTWEGVGCMDLARQAIAQSLAVRPSGKGHSKGWSDTCARCRSLGASCTRCDETTIAEEPGDRPVDSIDDLD